MSAKELEEKRAKRLEEEKKKSKTARKPRARRKDYYGESKSAEEAIEKLVSRQRLSNKIDYEALRKVWSWRVWCCAVHRGG